jgi:hypothetical protein
MGRLFKIGEEKGGEVLGFEELGNRPLLPCPMPVAFFSSSTFALAFALAQHNHTCWSMPSEAMAQPPSINTGARTEEASSLEISAAGQPSPRFARSGPAALSYNKWHCLKEN